MRGAEPSGIILRRWALAQVDHKIYLQSKIEVSVFVTEYERNPELKISPSLRDGNFLGVKSIKVKDDNSNPLLLKTWYAELSHWFCRIYKGMEFFNFTLRLIHSYSLEQVIGYNYAQS